MPGWKSFEAFLRDAVQTSDDAQRQTLVDDLLRERTVWPWINDNRATFAWNRADTHSAAVNLDTIKGDPPFARMIHLEGTSLWYVTLTFEHDDLLDYLLAIDDPMTPLKAEPDLVNRMLRHWQIDPLNPLRMQTSQVNVSVLRMPDARPFPDWESMKAVTRGTLHEHIISSRQLNFAQRRLNVYTPPGYDPEGDREYPLLIVLDGQWGIAPLQIPYMADALIKHNRVQPMLIAMLQSGSQEERTREFAANDRHYLFLLTELLPFVQSNYRVDPLELGVAGVGIGAAGAVHAALMNPVAFNHLIMISPPLHSRGGEDEKINRYLTSFEQADTLPLRIFQSVGRYELASRFLQPAHQLAETLHRRRDVAYQFVEVGSGHSLAGFKAILPEALAWVFPGSASQPDDAED